MKGRYRHECIWKGIQFFTLLISGLLTVSLTIFSINMPATLGILVLTITFTFLGHYVLRKEGEYFQIDRYNLIKTRNKLGIYEKYPKLLAGGDDNPESAKISIKKYLEQYLDATGGIRYAFRVVYFFEAIICCSIIFVILWLTEPIFWLLVLAPLIITIGWYRWEIVSLLKKARMALPDP